MGCHATAWVGNTKRCLICWGQEGKPNETPCPKAREIEDSISHLTKLALREVKHFNATAYDFRPNGGGYTWTLMRLWLRSVEGWHSTSIACASDTDRSEMMAIERHMQALGVMGVNAETGSLRALEQGDT